MNSRESSWRLIAARRDEEVTLLDSARTISIGGLTPFMPALVSLLPPENPLANLFRHFLLGLAGIRYYPLQGDYFDDYYVAWCRRPATANG